MNKLRKLAMVVSRFWNNWGRDWLIVIALMIPFRSSIADWNHVPTGSMKPTILECERVFVNKLAYDLKIPLTTKQLALWRSPERGDIVVFNSPADGTRLVKRVIGLPGDVIAMQNNKLIINNQLANYLPLDKAYTENAPSNDRPENVFARETLNGLDHAIMTMPSSPARRSFAPVTVPDDHYLMLGDNRDNSADSRFFGFVPRDRIIGKVPMIVASFDRDNFYRPRLKRWFTKL